MKRLGPAGAIALEFIRENPGVTMAQVDRARRTARGGHRWMYRTIYRLIHGGWVRTGKSTDGRGVGLYAILGLLGCAGSAVHPAPAPVVRTCPTELAFGGGAPPAIALSSGRACLPADPTGACTVSFVAEGDLLDYVERAAQRWSAATGCKITASTGHGTWEFVTATVLRDSTTRLPVEGIINFYQHRAQVLELLPMDEQQLVVDHLMGNALAGFAATTTTGLMASKAQAWASIDAASLGYVCSGLPCLEPTPESEK